MSRRLLIACEESGTVRDAFYAVGINAVSCDILPSATPGPHIQGDIKDILHSEDWLGVIAFPPCTDICSSGARWFPEKIADGRQQAAIDFFMRFTRLKCSWAIENPVGIMSTLYRKPDQILNPFDHGHGERKATCLWLNALYKLTPTNEVSGREQRVWKMPPSPDRAKLRSKTYPGIARAMAIQWSPIFFREEKR